ncbi:hypothetical protein [[Acholeplasma] multilocale]|uniref:hypothetical protein n=1 Tax=[Acholeplasma] multilocale TaxID=264638 RepID=UPI0006865C6D|nr:hypothetical protein [[Acholeplasma] multilocale]
MKQIYNAGSMFNEAQVNQRKIEGVNMRGELTDFIIKNPIDFDTNQSVTPTPLQIWATDYQAVTESEYVICELDSLDHGMIMEFAIAIEQAKTTQLNKFVIAVVSDFRYYQKGSTTQMAEIAINHFVYGALFDEQLVADNRVYLVKSHNAAIELIKLREEYLRTTDSKILDQMNLMNQTFIYEDGSMFN